MAHVHVPAGTAIANCVSTSAFPRAGMIVSCALYKSYPAANALPLVGVRALFVSFFMNRGGDSSFDFWYCCGGPGGATGPLGIEGTADIVVGLAGEGLGRFARGD